MVSSNGFLHRVPDQNSNDKIFFRFPQSTGSPVNVVLNRLNRFSENLTVNYFENLRLWSVFHQKFFGDIFFDTWHLHWCQMTLFCIFITAEHDEMIVYLSESFLKRNFLTIFFLTFDTSIGVKWHFFVFLLLLNMTRW